MHKHKLIISITLAVIVMVVLFYFWESFLFNHFLGGFDQYDLPMQITTRGYYLFFASWPMWALPLIFTIFIIMLVKINKKSQEKSMLDSLQKKLEQYERELGDSEAELDVYKKKYMRVLNNKSQQKPAQNEAQLKEFRQLEKDFELLQEDYQRSLDFIEKLLDRMPDDEASEDEG